MAARPDEGTESERLRRDVERTRALIRGTVDEIQDRLTPSRLLHEASASVRGAGRDSMRRVLSQAGRTVRLARATSALAAGGARTHPVPATLVVAGLALVVARTFIRGRRTTARSRHWLADAALGVGAAVAAVEALADASRRKRRAIVR